MFLPRFNFPKKAFSKIGHRNLRNDARSMFTQREREREREGWGAEPPTKFSKRGGLDRTSTFRRGLLRKRGEGRGGEGRGGVEEVAIFTKEIN